MPSRNKVSFFRWDSLKKERVSDMLGRAGGAEVGVEVADLVMRARGAVALEQAARSISTIAGVTVVDVVAYGSEPRELDKVATTALDKIAKVDILLTNSGGPPSGPF